MNLVGDRQVTWSWLLWLEGLIELNKDGLLSATNLLIVQSQTTTFQLQIYWKTLEFSTLLGPGCHSTESWRTVSYLFITGCNNLVHQLSIGSPSLEDEGIQLLYNSSTTHYLYARTHVSSKSKLMESSRRDQGEIAASNERNVEPRGRIQ